MPALHVLVPKLLLGNALFLPKLCLGKLKLLKDILPADFAKQELCSKRVPKRELGNQKMPAMTIYFRRAMPALHFTNCGGHRPPYQLITDH